jgi:hypothetical protein
VPPLQLGLIILISSLTQTLLISIFLCLSKPSPKAQESFLNLPGQLTQIAYPIGLPGITRALPERVLLTRPYPIALPGRVTPYRLCPRSFTRADNLPLLSLVDLTLSLSAKFGLHLTRLTTRFYLYQPLTQFGFPNR